MKPNAAKSKPIPFTLAKLSAEAVYMPGWFGVPHCWLGKVRGLVTTATARDGKRVVLSVHLFN